MNFDDWEDIRVYTYEELEKQECDWFNSLSDEQKNFGSLEDSFEQHILSYTKPYDIIEINFSTYKYEVIGNTLRNKKLERILK